MVFAPLAANSADMLYRQSFETPIESHPEIQWKTHGYEITQAVVEHQPRHGNKSVRGNFNASVTDPIAKIKGNPFVQFKINFDDAPQLKDWYHDAPRVYVSWWFKLDTCVWKGTEFNNNEIGRFAGKLAYIRMNENPSTSYYFTMEGGQSGKGTFSVNYPAWMSIWEKLYGRAALYLSNQEPFGADGKWHKVSFLIETSSDGKYLTWWMNDNLMTSSRFGTNGRQKIYDGFVLDSIQFWHTKQTAVNLTEGACNGWQIDDVQVWDDVPNRPRPPYVQ